MSPHDSSLDPIDDVDEPEITAEDVEKRVDDWLRRLSKLFGKIRDWAARNRWNVADGGAIRMHEPLMRRFNIPARDQPTLTLRSPAGAAVWIRPKGLWVIGANGRVDLYSSKGAFVLVDVADKFQEPHWILHEVGGGEGRTFEPEQLADIS